MMNTLQEFKNYYGRRCFDTQACSDHQDCWKLAYRRARIARREGQNVCSPYDLKRAFHDAHLLPYLVAALHTTQWHPGSSAWVESLGWNRTHFTPTAKAAP